jgi:hypothetical protein
LVNGVAGTAYSDTIHATGGVAPYTWTVSAGALPEGLSLSASTTNSAAVSGTPLAVAQGVAFTIEVADSAQHTASQAYTVSILPQPDSLGLSPASLEFGDEVVGTTSGALTETLTNTATLPITIISVTVTGPNAAEFNPTTDCGASLAAGATCTVSLSFTPVQTGPRTAALTIIDGTAGSPQSLSLSGTGVTAGPNATLSVSTLPFGIQLVGTTSPALGITVTNYGQETLNIAQLATTSGFAETDGCLPGLIPGGSCTIRVTFTPGGPGDVTGELSVSDDAPGSPQIVSLSGTGSTSTPLLTGYCLVSSSVCTVPLISRIPTDQCPRGRPAEHPIGNPYCPGPGHGTVDASRPCGRIASTRSYHGYCEAR